MTDDGRAELGDEDRIEKKLIIRLGQKPEARETKE
jgi:hypothetical protein